MTEKKAEKKLLVLLLEQRQFQSKGGKDLYELAFFDLEKNKLVTRIFNMEEMTQTGLHEEQAYFEFGHQAINLLMVSNGFNMQIFGWEPAGEIEIKIKK